jgi:hypothetical protein
MFSNDNGNTFIAAGDFFDYVDLASLTKTAGEGERHE